MNSAPAASANLALNAGRAGQQTYYDSGMVNEYFRVFGWLHDSYTTAAERGHSASSVHPLPLCTVT